MHVLWIRKKMVELKDVLRYATAYQKAMAIVVPVALAIVVLAAVLLREHMSPESMRSGLGVIAEVSGAVLGALLVVIALLVEQRLNARQHLRRLFRKYRPMVSRHSESIDHVRRQIVADVEAQKVMLDDPAWETHHGLPSDITYRDVITWLSALCLALDDSLEGEVEGVLDALGYDEDEKASILYVDSHVVTYDAEEFFELVAGALDARFFCDYSDQSGLEFCLELFEEQGRDGIDGALDRLKRSKAVLGGKLLALNAALLMLTIVGSASTIISVSNGSTSLTVSAWVTMLLVTCFCLSVVSALLLAGRLLR